MSDPVPLTPVEQRRRLPALQQLGLVLVIALLCGLLAFFGGNIVDRDGSSVNNFFRASNLLGGILTPMSTVAIMAVGATFVIISGGIDISVACIFALSALGTVAVLERFPADAPAIQTIPTAIAISCSIGVVCGLVNGALIVFLRLHPFIVTLGTMGILRGICNVAVPMKTLPTPGRAVPASFTLDFLMWQPFPSLLPVPMLIMLLCVAAGGFYLYFTVAGRQNYAIGGNEEAARFSGINVGRTKLYVYGLAGLAAGIAGMVYAGYYGSASSNTGLGWELAVIAAAVVGGASLSGGRGTALGALLGTLVIKIIENGIFIMQYDQQYASILVGAAIIVAAALDRWTQDLRQRRLAGR